MHGYLSGGNSTWVTDTAHARNAAVLGVGLGVYRDFLCTCRLLDTDVAITMTAGVALRTLQGNVAQSPTVLQAALHGSKDRSFAGAEFGLALTIGSVRAGVQYYQMGKADDDISVASLTGGQLVVGISVAGAIVSGPLSPEGGASEGGPVWGGDRIAPPPHLHCAAPGRGGLPARRRRAYRRLGTIPNLVRCPCRRPRACRSASTTPLGDEIANDLVEWFNQVDATYRQELREQNDLNWGPRRGAHQRLEAEVLAQVRQEFRGCSRSSAPSASRSITWTPGSPRRSPGCGPTPSTTSCAAAHRPAAGDDRPPLRPGRGDATAPGRTSSSGCSCSGPARHSR
ncbi:MAG: hypothetical protein IPG75_20935 [Gemmatimonadetes bacterium]|nr:hypothetical protein [Gemmatimonadota bacterium]